MTAALLRHARCVLLMACAAVATLPAIAAETAPRLMRHYAMLEQALPRYRELAGQPALTMLPSLPRRSLQPGEPYTGVAALRNLLVAVGDHPASASSADAVPAVLDPALVAALRRFQERHGLEPDGILGPATWRALTTPMATRVRQIELTLARWRALPANPHGRAIFINIPRFRLYAVNGTDDRESAMLQMDVVVGKAVEQLRTPVFSADLTHLIFRPYWEVPRSILVNEILPAARKDPAYLEHREFELVDSAGKPASPADPVAAMASGAMRVRQRPGPGNALGAVKFMLPNANNVYLHDTPEKSLFSRPTRAFSHGCIRVAQPALLAKWLLDDDPAWTPRRIAEAMNGSTPMQVNLAEPVRVYIVYGTAIAREDGTLLFLEDLYGLDGH